MFGCCRFGIALFLIARTFLVAAELRGFVRLRSLEGDAVVGAAISGSGAAPVLSSSTGEFTLEFPNFKPGDPVTLTISKPGLIVLHASMTKLLLPADHKRQLVDIILCPEKDRYILAVEYFNLRSQQSLGEYERQERGKFAAQGGATREQLEQLERELMLARNQARDFAEKLASFKSGGADQNLDEAMMLFAQGRKDEALSLLSEESLRLQEKKTVEVLANSWLARAQMLVNRVQIEEARRAFDEAVRLAPQNVEVLNGRGRFLADNGRPKDATADLEGALKIARAAQDAPNLGRILNNLGTIYTETEQVDLAFNALKEAVDVQRRLAADSSEESLLRLSWVLGNFGNVLHSRRQFDAARAAYEESIAIARRLALDRAESISDSLVQAISNLGGLHADQDRPDLARTALEEAVVVARRFAQANPGAGRPLLAVVLANLANVFRNDGRGQDAQRAFAESATIYRELVRRRPGRNIQNLAEILYNLALLHKEEGHSKEVLECLNEALMLIRQLQERSAGALGNSTAGIVLLELGDMHFDQKRSEDARAAFEEALDFFRRSVKTNPEEVLPLIAGTLRRLGGLYEASGRRMQLRAVLEESIPILRQLAESHPDSYRVSLAEALARLGDLQQQRGDFSETRKLLEESIGHWRQLVTLNAKENLFGYLVVCEKLSGIVAALSQEEEAFRLVDEGFDFVRKNPTVSREEYLQPLAKLWARSGALSFDRGDLQRARLAWEESLSINRELARRTPDEVAGDVAVALQQLGNIALLQSRNDDALPALEEALALYRKLLPAESKAYLPHAANVSNCLAALYHSRQRAHDAFRALEEAIAWHRQLLTLDSTADQGELAMTLENFGMAQVEQGRPADALRAFEEALALRRKLAGKEGAGQIAIAELLGKIGSLHRGQKQMGVARSSFLEATAVLQSVPDADRRKSRTLLDQFQAELSDLEATKQ